MIILVHRNVVYNIFVLVCVSNEIQVQHEANRAGGVFLREVDDLREVDKLRGIGPINDGPLPEVHWISLDPGDMISI